MLDLGDTPKPPPKGAMPPLETPEAWGYDPSHLLQGRDALMGTFCCN